MLPPVHNLTICVYTSMCGKREEELGGGVGRREKKEREMCVLTQTHSSFPILTVNDTHTHTNTRTHACAHTHTHLGAFLNKMVETLCEQGKQADRFHTQLYNQTSTMQRIIKHCYGQLRCDQMSRMQELA